MALIHDKVLKYKIITFSSKKRKYKYLGHLGKYIVRRNGDLPSDINSDLNNLYFKAITVAGLHT